MKGRACEALIRKVARALEAADVARLWKWPEEKVTKKHGMQCRSCGSWYQGLEVINTARPGTDFFGFTSSGRVVLIECKQTDKARLEIGEKGVKAHQFYALHDCHRAGGIALLCWLHKKELAVLDCDMIQRFSGERRSIPWKEIPDRFIRTVSAESRPLEMLEPFLVG